MDLLLKDKIILITGGSKGLGLACAKSILKEGASVIISSRSENNLKSAVDLLSNSLKNGFLDSFPCDVSKPDDISELRKYIEEKYGRLDGLIMNAGGPPTGSINSINSGQWEGAIKTNLLSVVNLTGEFIPLMKKTETGRIIAITSISAKEPLPNMVLSNTTRLGVTGFMKTLSEEVGKDGILVNCVMPGLTRTERLNTVLKKWAESEGISLEEVIKRRAERIALKRLAEPDEFAAFVTYLISPRNTYITGQSIAVDGGFLKSA